MVFSADETCDVGSDTASPVSDDYTSEGSRFTGTIEWVQLDIAEARRGPRPPDLAGGAPQDRDGAPVNLVSSGARPRKLPSAGKIGHDRGVRLPSLRQLARLGDRAIPWLVGGFLVLVAIDENATPTNWPPACPQRCARGRAGRSAALAAPAPRARYGDRPRRRARATTSSSPRSFCRLPVSSLWIAGCREAAAGVPLRARGSCGALGDELLHRDGGGHGIHHGARRRSVGARGGGPQPARGLSRGGPAGGERGAGADRARAARRRLALVSVSSPSRRQAVRRRLDPVQPGARSSDLRAVESTAREAMAEMRRLFGLLRAA